MKKLTREIVIQKFEDKHKNKYDYSLFFEYENMRQYINIICPKHGIFNQQISMHKIGQGCPGCKKDKLSQHWSHNINDVKEKFIKIHGDKYDYSNFVEYIGTDVHIDIKCYKHGLFKQTPHNHLNGQGCPECFKEIKNKEKRLGLENFIEMSNKVHKKIYNYDCVIYTTNKSKIKIICPNHGYFYQRPNNHLMGEGCPHCKISKGEKEIMSYLSTNNVIYIHEKIFDDCVYKNKLPFDFYLPEYNTCIEYDGIQHFESIDFFGGISVLKDTKKRDKIKNEYCENNNIKLLRIKYTENVSEKIKQFIN